MNRSQAEPEAEGEFDVESPRRVMTRSMARAGRETHLPRQGIIRPSRRPPRPDPRVEGSGINGAPVPVMATNIGGPFGTTANASMASSVGNTHHANTTSYAGSAEYGVIEPGSKSSVQIDTDTEPEAETAD
eukprot:CAMPEP_0197388658 /NCGR_PEP_ID=MMETSP1165-20131217/1196_1 /TAXON_ID=284809 /ORGANISM="Chrysocystis fragilis, Strain CCMP3189" /LENGTH=130 /DNA_ID=CAMNT_0042914009 /DNA_START=59 /DNA_END=448 /DNA_ORIENTATION=-